MQAITFNSNGYRLAGNLFVPDGPKDLAFLFIQGWTGHQNLRAAQMLCDMGYTCLTYDMRGNRDSEGDIADFSRADFCEDAEVAYDFLKSNVADNVRICVIGSSFGSYTACILSSRRDVFALSLRVPANYPDEGFEKTQLSQISDADSVYAWRAQRLDWRDNMALQAIHEFKGPIQIIQSGADEQVMHETVENYVRAVSNQGALSHEIMDDAPHSLINEALNHEYGTLLTGWVNTL